MAKILLVEDEDVQRKALEAILRAGGHEILLAGNGAQAIVVARDKHPDILVSDIQMPKMKGTELTAEIRKSPGLENTYCILVTAREGDGVKLESLLSGADDFVHKPVTKDDLLGRIQIGLRIRKLRGINLDLTGKVDAFRSTQEALVAALDAVLRGMEEAVTRLQAEDGDGALASLRGAHENVKAALAQVPLDE